ncbi:uncharacterized protein IUM83_17941 [Phytophthora cinnamomi]|uniref:uncharacterized protein n=1 Tax=Phytophthora cinnamomi TaxID=4785 RepID=UPI003559E924|nr:hypothetical protein IUM83_17941 [Phytophthora cinnamomi]
MAIAIFQENEAPVADRRTLDDRAQRGPAKPIDGDERQIESGPERPTPPADRPGSDRVLTQTGLFGKCRVEVVLRLTQLASGTLGLGFERDNEGLGGITSRSDQAEGSASLALAGFQTIDISLKGTPSRSPRTRGDLRGRGRSGSGFGRRQSRLDPIQGTRGDVQIVAGEIQIMLLCRDLRSQVGCLRSCKI